MTLNFFGFMLTLGILMVVFSGCQRASEVLKPPSQLDPESDVFSIGVVFPSGKYAMNQTTTFILPHINDVTLIDSTVGCASNLGESAPDCFTQVKD